VLRIRRSSHGDLLPRLGRGSHHTFAREKSGLGQTAARFDGWPFDHELWPSIHNRLASGILDPVDPVLPPNRNLIWLARIDILNSRNHAIPRASMNQLEIRRLSKSFGAVRAVDNVNLEVRPGEIYGLLGPNGAGKTTTISIVCGLLKPDAGEVLIEGQGFHRDPARARRLMGVVPQDIAVYEELSGRDNLEFWGRLSGLDRRTARARAEELLDALALTDRGRDAVKLYSGGMKRRVNLGCALLHRPRLLLLDEPTVGIDVQARMSILEFIRGLTGQGTAILYTTHYLEEAETLCQRIGIIDQGRILAEGTLPELQQRLGGTQLFAVEGAFENITPDDWPGFLDRFRVIQKTDRQLVVSALDKRDPAEGLKALLALPIKVENVTLKRPTLNEVFLQLTGRALRE
jgi:ABC-2 type transport system ATP-binding protein